MMKASFSALERSSQLNKLKDESFDLVVIGGGITGAGIALDAVSRGLKVLLVEMQDFSAGTSSRSTRLIHGGLRYLEQFEFNLVSEVGKEREIIYRNAQHLVRPEPLLLPLTKNASHGKWMTRLGMLVYEYLAGVKKGERHQVLNKKETQNKEPLLKQNEITGGVLYYEYHTDDARLTISVLKEAVKKGLQAFNYLKVTGFEYQNGKISGVKAQDQMSSATITIKTKYVVNASGPWVDEVDGFDPGTTPGKLQLTKGVHLLFDHSKLPIKQAIYFQTPDKRMVFAIPHRGKTYVGTTDTFYNGNKEDPQIETEDKEYLLSALKNQFSNCGLKVDDIESAWAGLRPLVRKPGKAPSEISRRDEIFVSSTGLISIAGGKLTAYRKMAQRVMDLLAEKILRSENRKLLSCSTAGIQLSGSDFGHAGFLEAKKQVLANGMESGLKKEEAGTLFHRYGSETSEIFAKLNSVVGLESDLAPLLRAELMYSITNEMCLSPIDFFVRRTGNFYFDIKSVRENGSAVILFMKQVLAWNDEVEKRYSKELDMLLESVK